MKRLTPILPAIEINTKFSAFGLLFFIFIFSTNLYAGKLKFTSKPEKKGEVGKYYEYEITTNGSDFWTRRIFLESGHLPEGLKLVDNGDGTAKLSGIPLESGDFELEIKVRELFDEEDQSFTLSIKKGDATITFNNLNTTYNGSPRNIGVSTDPPGLDVKLTYNGSGQVPVNVGSYKVEGVIESKHYDGKEEATFTIKKADATISVAGLEALYNGSPRPVSVTTNPANLPVSITYNGSSNPPKEIGSYSVKVEIDDRNYEGSFSGTLTIKRADASITINNLTHVYSGQPQGVSIVTSPAGLGYTVTYNGSSTVPVEVGNYAVKAKINDSRYEGEANGTLNISKAEATILLKGLSSEYNGSPKTVNAETTPAGLSVKITYNGSSNPPVQVGSYTVEAEINEKNYKGSVKETLTIAKAKAELVFGNLITTYTGEGQGVEVTTLPSGLEFIVTYNGLSTLPIEVGSYEVHAKVVSPNYQGTATDTFVIEEAGPGGSNGKPVLTNIEQEALLYTQGDSGKPVSETILINDFDNAYMQSARISINENFDPGSDVLSYNPEIVKITGSYDKTTGVLELLGEDTRSNYELALRNVTYKSKSLGETRFRNKNIEIVVNDGFHDSDPAFRSLEIIILPEIEIVNAFTPNGDNVNDRWDFVNLEEYSSVRILVFNADGKVIYDCSDSDCAWDGTFKGKELPAGAYYYTITLNNGKRKYQGTVTMLK